MKKKILARLYVCLMLTALVGCDIQQVEDTTTSTVISPELYNMNSFVQKVYTAAGYDYSYEDLADGEAVLDEYVSTLGFTWRDVLSALSGTSPSTDKNIMALCRAVGLSTSEIDWTTYDSLYNLPNMSPAASKATNLTADRDAFATLMQSGAIATYRDSIVNSGGSIPSVGTIDAAIFAECLNKDMTLSRIAEKYEYKAMTGSDQLIFKVASYDSSFYGYTERNGCSYIIFYPTVCNPNNAGKYLLDCDGDTNIPLWQEYFIAYADWCTQTYGVDLSNGIYNVTNDGIEVWWPTSDGYSLELDVYESGLIRVVRSSDNRYNQYASTNVVKDPRVPEELYTWCNTNYGLTRADVNALYALAQIFQLNCVESKEMVDWSTPASIYVSGLHVIGNPDAYMQYSVGDILSCLIKFAQINNPEYTFSYSDTLDAVPMSSVSNADLVSNRQIVQKLLDSVNASNSVINIAHLNAATSKVTYIKPDDPRMSACKEKYLSLTEDELVKWTFEKWVYPIMGYNCVNSAMTDNWDSIDYDVFSSLIDKVEEVGIAATDTFGEYFTKLKELSTYDRSDIIYTAIYNIPELPTDVLGVYIHSDTSLESAYTTINKLREAIGSNNTSATDIALIFELKEGDSPSNPGNSGSTNW